MSLKTGMNHLPVWDRKLAEGLTPLKPFFGLIFLGIIALCLWAYFKWEPQYQALLIAFIVSP